MAKTAKEISEELVHVNPQGGMSLVFPDSHNPGHEIAVYFGSQWTSEDLDKLLVYIRDAIIEGIHRAPFVKVRGNPFHPETELV